MPEPGTVVLAMIQFADTFEIKIRPAVVLYEEHGNIVVAGITSNTRMRGIPLTTEDGAFKDSVIKLNYIFTITDHMVHKTLFSLPRKKWSLVVQGITRRLGVSS